MKNTSVNLAVMSLLCRLANQNGFGFFLEHVAVAATGSLSRRIHNGLKMSDFETKKQGDNEGMPFFLQHISETNLRIEILTNPEVPGHEAFRIIGALDDYKTVITSFMSQPGYELLDQSVDTEHIQAEMFHQIKTGAVFQIIHRSDESVFFDGFLDEITQEFSSASEPSCGHTTLAELVGQNSTN